MFVNQNSDVSRASLAESNVMKRNLRVSDAQELAEFVEVTQKVLQFKCRRERNLRSQS